MLLQIPFVDLKSTLSVINTTSVKIAFALLTFILGFIIGKIVERVTYKALTEIEINKLITRYTNLKINADSLISSILAYIIYFVSFIAALNQLGVSGYIVNMLSILLTIVVAVSFFLAVRDFIPNIIAGTLIYKKEGFKEEAYIEVGDIKGEIMKLDLLQVKIKTKSGDIIYIPNSTVAKSNVKIKKRKS
ncbi:MAG: mechanosensitive ion channel domain-containing protein [Nanoarchaeota archaeon]